MGIVNVRGLIGADQEHLQEVEFLVDTGSLYTFVTPEMARRLGVAATTTSRVVMADGRTTEVGGAAAYLRLMDREGGVIVGIMGVPFPILGVTSLEILGLKVNPVEEVLEHARPFGPAAL